VGGDKANETQVNDISLVDLGESVDYKKEVKSVADNYIIV
jgi:hypothetical protein